MRNSLPEKVFSRPEDGMVSDDLKLRELHLAHVHHQECCELGLLSSFILLIIPWEAIEHEDSHEHPSHLLVHQTAMAKDCLGPEEHRDRNNNKNNNNKILHPMVLSLASQSPLKANGQTIFPS